MKIIVKNAKVITERVPARKNRNTIKKRTSNFNDYEYATGGGEQFEYAIGKKKKKDAGNNTEVKKNGKEKLKGFGQKLGNAARKVGKAFKNFVGNMKARKAARQLHRRMNKYGKPEMMDPIPALMPKNDGPERDILIRPNPDGTTTEFKKDEVAKGPNGKIYAKEDLNKTGTNTVENGELIKVIDPKDVKVLKTTDGEDIPFHKDDVIGKDEPDDAKPGDKTKNLFIYGGITAGVIALGVAIYFMAKKSK